MRKCCETMWVRNFVRGGLSTSSEKKRGDGNNNHCSCIAREEVRMNVLVYNEAEWSELVGDSASAADDSVLLGGSKRDRHRVTDQFHGV